MTTATTTCMRALVALDIDGTLVDGDRRIASGTVELLDLVRAAGHDVVLATGRSLAGLLPIATRLGLTTGWAVCSNGAVTVRLDRAAPSGYDVVEARMFEPRPVIRRALDVAPSVRIAVEEIGWGWRTSGAFEPSELNGQQKTVLLPDLMAEPVTRLALVAPGVRRYAEALHATGVTVAPQGPDWLDVTAPAVNKAVALEVVRAQLDVPAKRTVAVGDGVNDLDMLAWAGRSVAMGQAPAIVLSAADQVTGTIGQAGVLPILASLVPAVDGALSPLAAQLATAERTAPGPVVLRVWHGTGPDLARCETWALQSGHWVRHGPVPSGVGTTMRAIEKAALEAGLPYPRGDEGRRRAQWRSVTGDGPAGFELPLSDL
ncbi:HAD-superfamily hydrolase, subfamily IIB [Promicromonospora umidemergens]|uniref:Hydroxymethylpyrimidine pyrophosphatase-like HAD family hydrolase n=1 Tax=Promicromonospora umidemergens TaxID=629679 RepID=A0ABP8WF99_9MICO|nr:HAD family hydrolase [Promicromonospora umidemergens]MCP2286557.1 HAD-superfamily hydrolase, subfamily IIB [Promicromonospora umidemergens]